MIQESTIASNKEVKMHNFNSTADFGVAEDHSKVGGSQARYSERQSKRETMLVDDQRHPSLLNKNGMTPKGIKSKDSTVLDLKGALAGQDQKSSILSLKRMQKFAVDEIKSS